ncbi:hypothetical protein RYX36_032088, partial [Vicia faba]
VFFTKDKCIQQVIRSSHPTGDSLLQKLQEIDIARNQIRLDGLSPLEKEESMLKVQDEAKYIGKILDDSTSVIILGDIVFLKPEQ